MPAAVKRKLRPRVTMIHRSGRVRNIIDPDAIEHRNENDLTPLQEVVVDTYTTELTKKPHGAVTRTAKKLGKSPVTVSGIIRSVKGDDAINQKLNAHIDETWATRENIIKELCYIAHFNIQDLIDKNDNLLPITEWPEGAARAIMGMDVERRMEGKGEDAVEVFVLKPRAVSKIQALEILGRIAIPELRRSDVSVTPVPGAGKQNLFEVNFVKAQDKDKK